MKEEQGSQHRLPKSWRAAAGRKTGEKADGEQIPQDKRQWVGARAR